MEDYELEYSCTITIHARTLEELVSRYCDVRAALWPDEDHVNMSHQTCPLRPLSDDIWYCKDVVKNHPAEVFNLLGAHRELKRKEL